ncbi:MAG: hypothetical protein JO112_13830 [Planctomycetes bacterium]|nr:hypothetical protein [Planctomycetota bacterium]
MGFLAGRASFVRFQVTGRSPKMFGPEHLERLANHVIGSPGLLAADGVTWGWTAGDHILDTKFDLAKNILNDTLQFALRIDSLKIPGDLLRAYTQVELTGLAAGNPSGVPSARQKKEARETARERLEKEASDGRFLRRRAVPVLWDAQSRELLVGTTSATALERLHGLFQQTFGQGFEALGAGRRAFLQAEVRRQTRGVDDAEPSPFVPGVSPREVSWVPDEASRDYVGNEFLLWLWYVLDTESDTLALADGSEVTALLARNLVLECPLGQTGRESIRSDGPTRLPEARRAIQAGKLPRQAGLTLVRHDQQYELTLQAETLAVTGARLPAVEGEEERARLEERVNQIRHLLETLDLLYDAFGQRRFSAEWPRELGQMQQWLQREDRARKATG